MNKISVKYYEITDSKWEQIKALFPVAKIGRPPKDNRMVFNAILWIARSGSSWRSLPEHYGSWKTIYSRFCKWRDDGTLLLIFKSLNSEADYENVSVFRHTLAENKCISVENYLKSNLKFIKDNNLKIMNIYPSSLRSKDSGFEKAHNSLN